MRWSWAATSTSPVPSISVVPNTLSDPEWLILVLVLIGHQRLGPGRCGCGWREIPNSHARHVADTYAQMLDDAARRDSQPAAAGAE